MQGKWEERGVGEDVSQSKMVFHLIAGRFATGMERQTYT